MKARSVSIDPVTDKRFELLRQLGEGASGAVFLARDRETGEHTEIRQEIEHDRYTLGLLLGGSEGQDLVASARAALRACGISDPDANMHAYAPELLRQR